MTSKFEDIGCFLYTEGWTEEFHEQADVELVVEGSVFLAHSVFLCQSEIFQGALRDTATEGKKSRIESLFENVSAKSLDSFLAYLYSTDGALRVDQLDTAEKAVQLAIKCGFDRVAKRMLNDLTGHGDTEKVEFVHALKARVDSEKNMDMLLGWLEICRLVSHKGLEKTMSKFLAENRFLVCGVDDNFVEIRRAVFQCCDLSQQTMTRIVSGLDQSNEKLSSELKKWEDGDFYSIKIKCAQCHRALDTLGSYGIFCYEPCPSKCYSKKGRWTVGIELVKDH